MEEVGCSEEGQEEDPRPPHRHPHPKGEGPKGVGHHRRLPCEEGGATDEVGTSPASKVAQHIKEAMESPQDSVGAPLILCTLCWVIPRCGQNQDTSSW